jgi:hypothetical protein
MKWTDGVHELLLLFCNDFFYEEKKRESGAGSFGFYGIEERERERGRAGYVNATCGLAKRRCVRVLCPCKRALVCVTVLLQDELFVGLFVGTMVQWPLGSC